MVMSIVVTTDLSDESRRAFAPAVALAERLGLGIVLLGVVEDVPFEVVAGGGLAAAYPVREQVRADWELRLGELAKGIKTKVKVETAVVDAHDIPRAIAEFAQQRQASFIAMASHGRSGLRRLLLGSVAEAVLRHAHTPVIVFPPPAPPPPPKNPPPPRPPAAAAPGNPPLRRDTHASVRFLTVVLSTCSRAL